VVVLRNVTERPEGVEAGVLRLGRTNPERVYSIVDELLSSEAARAGMRGRPNPTGTAGGGPGGGGSRLAARPRRAAG
jgi:UDP-N-acetylglucosamine 2-epimerase (non-hydrolysing)